MNAQQLRNSILQEAICGRLVPQDPNDEPASVLLERIREEKKRLVKEGKLKKKDLEETPISEDEKPFDIPDSWEWVRWGALSESIQYGYNAPAKERGRIKMVRISDIQNGEIAWATTPYCDIEEQDIDAYKLKKNDILFARTGGTVGKSYLVSEEPQEAIYAGYLIRTRYNSQLYPQYLKMFMESFLYWEQLKDGTIATAQPNCNGQKLAKMILPLPPLAEQKRIVAKIEELLPKVEEYGKAQEALDKLNEELPERLKKSVLQEAISGKLVPQDPNDEPASVLLDKIRKEKAKLVKEGKLKKKDLVETPIEEDEIPFKIPESWEWCRVSTILNILDSQRKPVTKSDRVAGIYPYCGANGILDYVKDYIFDGKFVLVGEDGSVVTKHGNPVVNKIEGKIWVNNHAHILQEFGNLGYQDYIYYALMNTDISMFIHGFMPKYSQGDLRKTLVPLPPLAEQKRIVAKIEEAFKAIDTLS